MKYESEFHQQYVIPVIRATHEEDLYSVCSALIDGGLSIIEITLMSEAACKVIKRLSARQDLIIGAGTVLNCNQVSEAIAAGAKFLVSPGLNEEAFKESSKSNVPFIPGVLSPTEVMKAQELGCEMVKVFPAGSVGGSKYIRNLQGPFPKMKWMATGGIGISDANEYRQAGINCIGIGSHLAPSDLIEKKDWKAITKLAQDMLSTLS